MGSYLDFLSGDTSDDADSVPLTPEITEPQHVSRYLEFPTYTPPFHIARLKPTCFIDPLTRSFIRNSADERAAQEGAFFSQERADFAIDWTEYNCIVYEGDLANTPFYLEDWAYELYAQLFGWMIFDEERNCFLRRFRRVSGWVPKKNGKSPTLASIGTYLWAGDGEEGQKCYSVAKDGKMARIAHNHAVQFVRKNPRLAQLVKIDNSTLEMTYRPTNSTYSILYSGSSGTASNQEGLNGSTIVDETHVVSPDLIKVIERAGISRKEPVHIELSTTGYNVEGYGYDQFTRGYRNLERAEKGEVYNSRLLFFNYGVPQDTSLEDLRNPEKIQILARQANPAMGRLIFMSEFLAEWAESCQSDTKLYETAMYRLNLWHRSGQGAIAMSDWLKCGKAGYTIEDLREYPCVIGLDLSKNRDMTAVIVMFMVPTPIDQLPNKMEIEITGNMARVTNDSSYDSSSSWRAVEAEYDEGHHSWSSRTGQDDEVIGIADDTDIYEAITVVNIPYVIPFFFLPEATIPLYEKNIDLRQLSEGNNLILTPGLTIRPETIAQFVNNIADSVDDFRVIAGDPWRFKSVKKVLRNTYSWPEENCVSIKQTWENMAPAYEALERLVLSREFVHPNNRVYDWQLGNIVLVEDHSGNRRISKPKHGDYRKIDGIAATLNALTYVCNDEEMVPGSDGLFDVGGDEDDDD